MPRNLDESPVTTLARNNDVEGLTAFAASSSNDHHFFERNNVAEIICKWGNLQLLQAMVGAGLEIDSRCTETGNSLLHLASRYDQVEITVWLLKQKCINIDAVSIQGESALFIAAEMGRDDITSALVAAGANLEIEAEGRHTALYVAAMFGHERIVNLLCDAGANVNAVNFRGETPVFWATRYPPIVQMLLKCGADIRCVDNEGDNPAHLACLIGNQESYNLLLAVRPELAAMTNKNGICPNELAINAF